MILSSRLRKLRKEKGLTQQELGDLINVTKVSICCYEKGSRTPTLETLMELAQVFNVDLNYFLGYDTYVVAEDQIDYGASMAKEEIDVILELRKHANLYEKVLSDPKRMIELFEKKIR